jgi:curved DNA-binding protein CbpA
MNSDYYAILEISPDATQEEIKEQYRLLVHAWHPDKFPKQEQKLRVEERVKAINEAYATLSNPVKRAQYDKTRSSEQPRQSQSSSTKQAKQEASESEQQRRREERTQHKHEAEDKARQREKAESESEQQRRQEERFQRESEREAEAEARWEKKINEEEERKAKKSAESKPSFFKNLFNKGRCLVGAHKGQWLYDKPKQCTQIRICELCNTISTRTEHDWTEWQYQSDDNCRCRRSCSRCSEVDYDTQHNWTHWGYLGENDCTQVQVCDRCHEKSKHTRVVHDWSEWKYSNYDHTLIRTCRRCHETISRPVSESQPVEKAESGHVSQPVTFNSPISMSGIWLGGDGLPIQFQQVGNQVFFRGMNALGFVIVEGQGEIRGSQAHLAFRYFDGYVYDQGQAIMQILFNGRQMDGLVQYAVSGIRRPMRLMKQV